METENWVQVTDIQKNKRRNAQKWQVLKNQAPHIVIPTRAKKIQRKKNIDGLVSKLLSEEWIKLQLQGWRYVKVVKPEDLGDVHLDSFNILLPIENKWGDNVLFKSINCPVQSPTESE